MLTNEHLEIIDRSVLCWLATVSGEGSPGVSPKEIVLAETDRVFIANVASPNSARNVKQNPKVCAAFLDLFVQKGLQVFGRARLVNKADERFAEVAPRLVEIAGEAFPFASFFEITPETVRPIVAPRYRLYPETTEADQVVRAMRSYGVRPLEETPRRQSSD